MSLGLFFRMLSFCFPGRHPVTEVGGGQPKNLRVESVGRKEIASVFPWFFAFLKQFKSVIVSCLICEDPNLCVLWNTHKYPRPWEYAAPSWSGTQLSAEIGERQNWHCGSIVGNIHVGSSQVFIIFFPACILEFYVNTRPWDMETGSFMYVLGWAGPLTIANTVLVFRKLSRICACVVTNGVPHILTKQVTVQVLEG